MPRQYTYRPEHLATVLDKSLVDVLLDNSDQLRYAILHELRMRGFSPFNNRFHVRCSYCGKMCKVL